MMGHSSRARHTLITAAWLAAACLACVPAPAAAQAAASRVARTARPPALPPVSMTCPMHPDIVESSAGTCPICKMNLVPVRLDASWMCPVHAVVTEQEPGACRLCGRALVPVVVALTWTCRGEINDEFLEPGRCRDGTPRIGTRTLRPHGNHNPQHGGQFFMAPDTWHHLEGSHPGARVFRLHVYDDYSRPLAPADLKGVRGRVVTRERVDPATRALTELASFPLRLSKDGTYLEATIEPARGPATMTAKVRFKPDAPEYRFDFTFPSLTRDPAPRAAANATRAPAPAPARAPDTVSPPGLTAGPAAPDEPAPSPAASPLPTSMGGMLDDLRAQRDAIGGLTAQGDFGAVWVPAFRAKDLAVALEPHLAHLPDAQRAAAGPALIDVVRAAWLLDSVGDGGNRQAVEQAFSAFSDAVARLLAAFSPQP